MKHYLTGLALAVAIGPATVPTQDRPTERPSSQLLIDAVAFDRSGMPVTDLRREEVEVWIGGYRVPFETFTAVTPGEGDGRGRLIVLLLDDVTLPPQLAARAREAARRFVNRMSPGDQMAIVTLNGAMMESTDERSRLLRAIDTYNPQAVGVQRIDELGAHVLKTVGALARQIAGGAYGRKAIVGIGASWLLDRPIPPASVGRELRSEWVDAMRSLAAANASFYVIEPAGVGMAPVTGGEGGFARYTGGHAFVNTNDLNGAADRIMRETGSYYLIAVSDPPIQRKAELRELDVRVLRKGVSMRARTAIPGTR
jgi:VWFA-related protein